MIIISFSGGLGNQMFQYTLFKKFQSLGREVKADSTFYDENQAHNGFEIEKIFGLKLPRATKEEINRLKDTSSFLRKYRRFFRIFWKSTDVEQITFDFDGSIFSRENAYLNGYWQSEKFFKDIKSEIKRDFTFRNIDNKNKKMSKKILSTNSISLHIRRGDYENSASTKKLHGGICTLDYYNRAIKLMADRVNNPTFFIFSDDLDWAKENLKLPSKAFFVGINRGKNSYKDMFLMSHCKHNILANSSFSWWGAWLNANPKKIVICPSRWYNNKRLDSKDIVPESWTRI
jgi:hypothetical protein